MTHETPCLIRTPDGRCWRVDEIVGGRAKLSDIMSPTGYHEWVLLDKAGITLFPSHDGERVDGKEG